MPQQLNITAGPNKFELMLALFDNTSTEERTVRFGVAQGRLKSRLTVLVNAVEREDGSSESWNIEGTCHGKPVKIYFSTKTRTGTVVNR